MATAYISTRFPTGFKPADYSNIQNGSLALASTAYQIADNQHWLVMGDLELTNFYVGNRNSEWTNLLKTVTIEVPPFCQYAAFHFYAARNFDAGVPNFGAAGGVIVTSPVDKRTIHNIQYGEDITASAKANLSDASYGWSHVDGITPNPVTEDQSALKLVASTSETWTTVNVDITMGAKVFCRVAAFNLIPNQSGFVVT